MYIRNTALSALLTSTAMWMAGTASAQANEPQDVNDSSFEEIIVTAQKREQSALDVGIAISVVGKQEIQARRIETPSDLVVFTPNATVKENIPGLIPVVTIRGVGLNDFNATNNPATGVYIDEVSLSSLALLSSDLFDLERMEVLKGPQGTLYGRNSTAGALNIISAKPSFDGPSGRVSAGLGSYETRDLELMANIPVSETLAFRLSGKGMLQEEGFYFNESLGRDIGHRNVLAARAQALWLPSDNVEVLLKVENQRGKSELGSAEFFGAIPTPTEPNCPGSPGCSDFFGYTDTDGDPFRGSWSANPDYNFNQFGTTLRIDADLGFAELSSITGYIDFNRDYASDTDAGPLRLLDFNNTDDVKQISQELRLSGSTGIADWQIGGFYSVDDVATIYAGDVQDLFNTTTLSSADQKTKSLALFGNAEWNLSDEFSIITGLRITNEVRAANNFTQDNVSLPPASFLTMAPFGTPPIVLAAVDDEIDETSVDWKVGANWEPTDNMLVYASASQGTKSGGFFAGVATNTAQLTPYDQEKLVSYEAGIKGKLPDIGLRYEASAFYYDYSDVQTFIRDQGVVPVQRLGNIDEATIYGLDASLIYQPTQLPGLNLNAGIGLLSSELGAFETDQGPIAKGNNQPDAPETTLNLGGSYTAGVSDKLSLRLALDSRYQSETFRDAINDPLLFSDSYWVTNARISLFAEDDWDLSVWGKNISDKEYVTQGVNQLAFGTGFRVYGAPRTYGVSATKNF